MVCLSARPCFSLGCLLAQCHQHLGHVVRSCCQRRKPDPCSLSPTRSLGLSRLFSLSSVPLRCDSYGCPEGQDLPSLLDKQVVAHAPLVSTIVSEQLRASQVEDPPPVVPTASQAAKTLSPPTTAGGTSLLFSSGQTACTVSRSCIALRAVTVTYQIHPLASLPYALASTGSTRARSLSCLTSQSSSVRE